MTQENHTPETDIENQEDTDIQTESIPTDYPAELAQKNEEGQTEKELFSCHSWKKINGRIKVTEDIVRRMLAVNAIDQILIGAIEEGIEVEEADKIAEIYDFDEFVERSNEFRTKVADHKRRVAEEKKRATEEDIREKYTQKQKEAVALIQKAIADKEIDPQEATSIFDQIKTASEPKALAEILINHEKNALHVIKEAYSLNLLTAAEIEDLNTISIWERHSRVFRLEYTIQKHKKNNPPKNDF